MPPARKYALEFRYKRCLRAKPRMILRMMRSHEARLIAVGNAESTSFFAVTMLPLLLESRDHTRRRPAPAIEIIAMPAPVFFEPRRLESSQRRTEKSFGDKRMTRRRMSVMNQLLRMRAMMRSCHTSEQKYLWKIIRAVVVRKQSLHVLSNWRVCVFIRRKYTQRVQETYFFVR
jgi:hypothetical protein